MGGEQTVVGRVPTAGLGNREQGRSLGRESTSLERQSNSNLPRTRRAAGEMPSHLCPT